jgi:hypothetical protein
VAPRSGDHEIRREPVCLIDEDGRRSNPEHVSVGIDVGGSELPDHSADFALEVTDDLRLGLRADSGMAGTSVADGSTTANTRIAEPDGQGIPSTSEAAPSARESRRQARRTCIRFPTLHPARRPDGETARMGRRANGLPMAYVALSNPW